MRGLLPTALAALLAGAHTAVAIQFTNPAANATLTKGTTFDLTWTSVDTDPGTFSVYLVNFVNWPPYYEAVDLGVETSAGTASVRVPCDADSSNGFQFNAINGTNVYVIYAQTPVFAVAGESCTDEEPAPTAAPTASTCAAATSTATVTVTVRGNSSSPSTSTLSAGAAAVTGANLKLGEKEPGVGSSSSANTYQGECPSTIGWKGNYANPVTLTEVPNAGRGLVGVATTAPTAATTVASTLIAVPTAGSKALAGEKSSGKCAGTKERKVRKRHSDRGHSAPFPRK